MTDTPVRTLAQAGPEHGPKAASLAWLIRHGYRVPGGIVVRTAEEASLGGWVEPGQRYAVRSSASVEDGADFSFAGQFATVLDVEGLGPVRDAVDRVLQSARDDRVRPYLAHAGIDQDDIEMHVIVQRLVPAVAAGVAFSRNPLTGLADVLIEAVDGNGEALASGKTTPQRWVRHWGEWTERPDRSSVPEAVAAEVADVVVRIAEQWGAPIDVEWAWDGEAVSWLQVRPMTATDVPVYSNRLAKEFLPGMIPPLVWSINVPIVNRAWLDLFESVVGPLGLEPEDLARQFAYRAYFAMGAIGDIFEAMAMPRDLLEVLIGVEGGNDRPTFRPRMGVMRHLPRMGRLGWRLARYHHELDGLIPELQTQLARLDERDLTAMSARGLVRHLAELEHVIRRAAFANILAPLLFNTYGSILRRRLAKRGIEAEGIDVGAGDPELTRYVPLPRLRDLAEQVTRLDAAARERVAAGDVGLVPGMDDFLERFGHVSDSGNDFSHVPWREDPARLAPLLLKDDMRQSIEGRSLPDDLSRLDRGLVRRTARYRLERERVSYTWTRGYGQFRPVVLEIARRLVERGALEEADDVFYLTRDEMEQVLLADGHELAAVARARREEMASLAEVEMPEVIFGDAFEPAPPTEPDRRLRGTPSSRGVVRAPARVVRGVDEAHRVTSGDILVIPYSDIGWTPMLARAEGIVAESGGLLSHSSIVAREFGIPCVVSVDGAMRVPDGAIVRVDGYTGEVQWEESAGDGDLGGGHAPSLGTPVHIRAR